jgi:hypothetical protein
MRVMGRALVVRSPTSTVWDDRSARPWLKGPGKCQTVCHWGPNGHGFVPTEYFILRICRLVMKMAAFTGSVKNIFRAWCQSDAVSRRSTAREGPPARNQPAIRGGDRRVSTISLVRPRPRCRCVAGPLDQFRY